MCWVHKTIRGQSKQFGVDGVVEQTRVALLEVGASAAANQQGVAGKYKVALATIIRQAAVRVSRCAQHVQVHILATIDHIALLHVHIGHRLALRRDEASYHLLRWSMSSLDLTTARQMIGVHMSVAYQGQLTQFYNYRLINFIVFIV